MKFTARMYINPIRATEKGFLYSAFDLDSGRPFAFFSAQEIQRGLYVVEGNISVKFAFFSDLKFLPVSQEGSKGQAE